MTFSTPLFHEDEASDDIFTALFPSHIVQKLIGVAPFVIHGPHGNRKLVEINSRNPYNGIPYLLFVGLIVTFMYTRNALIDFVGIITQFHVLYEFCLGFAMLVAIITCHRVHKKRLIKTFYDFIIVDRSLSAAGLEIKNRRVRTCSTIWLIVEISIIVMPWSFLTYFFVYKKLFKVLFLMGFEMILLVYKTAMVVGNSCWIYSIAMRFELISTNLDKKQNDLLDARNVRMRVKWLVEIYLKLCRLTEKMNRIYSSSIFMDVFTNFTTLVPQLHFYFKAFYYEMSPSVNFANVTSMVISGLTAFDLITEVVICHVLTKKANSVKKALLKLTSQTEDVELRKEINAFSLQLLHTDVKITAGGFFTIDLPFLFGMIGAGSIYLIILIQFELALH